MTLALFLSDKAWEGLQAQAKKAFYIRTGTSRGLGYYLRDLVTHNPNPENWVDTRPPDLAASDVEFLEEGIFPIWDSGQPRYRHYVSPTIDGVLQMTKELALHFGTIKSNAPGTRGRPLRLEPRSLQSCFYEAVGLVWLTPRNIPEPVFRTKLLNQNSKELEW